MLRNYLLLLFLFLLGATQHLEAQALGEKATVSILTCQEGNELYSLYGHTAIRIKDEANALDVVYNYGTFDFNTEHFYLKFVKGDLRYFVTAYSYNEFYYEYTIENRSIYEQVLRLTVAQKQLLFETLNESLQSDAKYYTYKFIDRNCTNMVVDKVNMALGQNCIVKTTEKDLSYRQILFPYLKNHFYENLGINILFGYKTDQMGEKLFLPNQFMESLKVAKYEGQPISGAPKTLLKATAAPIEGSLWNNIYTLCLLLLLLVLARKAWVYLLYFSVFGILGILMTLAGFYSLHEELAANYNVLLFNPFLLLVLVFYWTKNYAWMKKTVQICIILDMAFFIVLLNKPNLVMFMPLIISVLLMLFYFLRMSNKGLLAAVK
jgi:hypothetical protein